MKYQMRYSSTIGSAFGEQWHGWRFIHFRNLGDDNLYVRYINWNGDRWYTNYNWLDNDWNSNNPAAVLSRNSFHFSLGFDHTRSNKSKFRLLR
jgi:hypothetical protein